VGRYILSNFLFHHIGISRASLNLSVKRAIRCFLDSPLILKCLVRDARRVHFDLLEVERPDFQMGEPRALGLPFCDSNLLLPFKDNNRRADWIGVQFLRDVSVLTRRTRFRRAKGGRTPAGESRARCVGAKPRRFQELLRNAGSTPNVS
jgi:hypothetical protein